MTMVKTFWKRSVAWATALKHKYWNDPFFQSEFNVISLQITFAICLITIVAIYFNNLFGNVTESLLQNLIGAIQSGTQIDPAFIIEETRDQVENNFVSFVIVAVLITSLFSYIIARITLRPAQTALKTQKRFIGDIAHELRTPLSIIKTNIEVALIDNTIAEDMRHMLLSNIEELDRTSEIINNLLSFNKLIRPEKLNFSRVDLGDVIDKSVQTHKELARKKQLEITVQKTMPHTVWGNTTALEQIVGNLIKNAITYTQNNGVIKIVTEPDYRGNVVLTIEDTGVGISRHDLAHIFEPFYRAERSRNRRAGSGSGLGLTIVSELIKMHSGRIAVRSYPNQGTTVTVYLPYSGHKAKEEPTKDTNEISVDFMQQQNQLK